MLFRTTVTTLSFAGLLLLGGPILSQQSFDAVEIKTLEAGTGVYMLVGAGGNLGVSVGEDGVFLIDDQYAPLTERIRAAVQKLDERPISFVLNTHWHGDHTGGNEQMGEAGSLIVAHENVRVRMSTEQFMEAFNNRVPASPVGALPVVTFTDTVTFHLNGLTIRAWHVEHAHTDGDSMVYFAESDVLHTGDVVFNGMYPFIDVSSGGSINGVIAAVELALEIVDAETRIISGHGMLSDPDQLKGYRDMLRGIRNRVAALIAEGKPLEEVQAAKPSAPYDEDFGDGFIKPDVFVSFVYDSLDD